MSLIIQTILIFCIVSYGFALILLQKKQSNEAFNAAKLAAEVALEAAKTSRELQEGLQEIHVLVNNNLTMAKKGELEQAKGRLDVLNRIRRPQEKDFSDIESVSQRVNVLEMELLYKK